MPLNLNNERDIDTYGFWDRLVLMFVPTHVYNDKEAWMHVYYKEYQGMLVIVSRERYR